MRSPILMSLFTLAPYHLVSWGTLLGMELYQSFVMTKLCYRHLPMQQFTGLQQHVFPVYFTAQAGLVLLTAATYPPAGLFSLLQWQNVWSVHVPLAVNLGMAGLNAAVYGPRTSHVMMERERARGKAREDRLAAKDPSDSEKAEREEAMKRIKRDFAKNHAMSIHLNAIGMIATVWYGLGLASKIKFVP